MQLWYRCCCAYMQTDHGTSTTRHNDKPGICTPGPTIPIQQASASKLCSNRSTCTKSLLPFHVCVALQLLFPSVFFSAWSISSLKSNYNPSRIEGTSCVCMYACMLSCMYRIYKSLVILLESHCIRESLSHKLLDIQTLWLINITTHWCDMPRYQLLSFFFFLLIFSFTFCDT